MVHLFDFTGPSDRKPLKDFATSHSIPKTWGGFIALFAPNEGPKKTGFWSAYWFARSNGKKINKARLKVRNQ